MMKKLNTLLAAAIMSVLGTAQAADHTLAMVVSTLNNPFFVTMKEGAEAKAKELGYELVVLDSQNDPAKELSNVEDLTVRKVNAILINPTDSEAVGNAIRLANKANIPVLTLDRGAAQGDVKLGDGSAVELGRGDDVVTVPGESREGNELRRHTAGGGNGANAALQRGDTLFEGRNRRITDARVDVAVLLQREEVGGILGVVKNE